MSSLDTKHAEQVQTKLLPQEISQSFPVAEQKSTSAAEAADHERAALAVSKLCFIMCLTLNLQGQEVMDLPGILSPGFRTLLICSSYSAAGRRRTE